MGTQISVVKSYQIVCDDCGRHTPGGDNLAEVRREAKEQHWARFIQWYAPGKYRYADLCPKCAIGLQS